MSASDVSPDVLFVIGGLIVGGAERHVATLASRLVRRNWRVSVYSLTGSGLLRQSLEAQGVEVILPPLERDPASRSLPKRLFRMVVAAAHLAGVMIRTRPAIVHFFLPAPYMLGAPLAVLARCRIRIMSRRCLNNYQAKYVGARQIERILHRFMSAVLANSQKVLEQLKEEGIPPERLRLIYNGVEVCGPPSVTSERVRAQLGIGRSALVLITVANLIPYKGHHDLLDALGGLRSKLPAEWKLLVVGRDDGIGAQLRARAGELTIADNVLFLGERDDVRNLLAASDIALLCSHEEGFSNAVLEGMAAGLPMIVTDVGGNPEAILNEECGLVVPPRRPDCIAEAIMRLSGDPQLRKQFGAKASQRVAACFGWDACIDAYERLYRGLAAGALRRRLPRPTPTVP